MKVSFFQENILKDLKTLKLKDFTLIISNPPYIAPSEKAEMSANVLNYEPHEALFVPEDRPLLFYEAIADFALRALKQEGMLFFETGSLFGKSVAEMLRGKGFRNIQLKQDISGNDRMICALPCIID
ncbi:hypothetical protein FACS189463_1910 [Bacteroidia bacterium]|nr:hypothetical protein FACS189463_1910 [Bacteroidia bacterium]